jgi:hypothetical protein
MPANRHPASLATLISSALACALLSLVLISPTLTFAASKPERFLSYTNEIEPSMPWSVHVVKVERADRTVKLVAAMGDGEVLGMNTVSDQLKHLPADWGAPVAAINGDFYEKSKDYPGRPRDLQLCNGEVVTQPTGHTTFWIDAQGNPHMTNIQSRFRILWPNGMETPFGMNQQRTNNAAVLYTAALGASTHTPAEGIEYVLEPAAENALLPLRIGGTCHARVKQVRTAGDAPLNRQTVVLSISPALAPSLPVLKEGDTLRLALETSPDLAGAEVAIGGGPALVQDGKPMTWKGWVLARHPRTALGWNDQCLFLVEVDGRQSDLSVGMTFPELADYLIKLGCTYAMNLDGGGSSTLWALGSVRNSPSEGQERPAPNSLVVIRKVPRQAQK